MKKTTVAAVDVVEPTLETMLAKYSELTAETKIRMSEVIREQAEMELASKRKELTEQLKQIDRVLGVKGPIVVKTEGITAMRGDKKLTVKDRILGVLKGGAVMTRP